MCTQLIKNTYKLRSYHLWQHYFTYSFVCNIITCTMFYYNMSVKNLLVHFSFIFYDPSNLYGSHVLTNKCPIKRFYQLWLTKEIPYVIND